MAHQEFGVGSEDPMPIVSDVLVCPLSKQPLERDGRNFIAPSGLRWQGGNFQVPLSFSEMWSHGQDHYETWDRTWLSDMESSEELRRSTDESVAEIYAQLPLVGDVLDVGGNIGTLCDQASIDPENYLSVDPIRYETGILEQSYPKLFTHYPSLPHLQRLQANAEFLPLRDSSFDTVHMRSVIDHLASPHIALLEAFRVLRTGGRLIIGSSLEGSYATATSYGGIRGSVISAIKRRPPLYEWARNIRSILPSSDDHEDHHVFHPTQRGLVRLLDSAGFEIEDEVWQSGHTAVLYVSASKRRVTSPPGLRRPPNNDPSDTDPDGGQDE